MTKVKVTRPALLDASTGDTHKARQVSKVGLFSKLSNLIRAVYDNGGAGALSPTDDGCPEAIYLSIFA